MFEAHIDDDLMLRTLSEDDAEELFGVVDANREHLREWLPWLDDNTTSNDTLKFIRGMIEQEAANLGITCTIRLQGRIVGVAGLHPIKWNRRLAEIGYWLALNASGRGIMTRCCKVLISHSFEVYQLDRVEIHAAVENKRSRAIPERLGFRLEGLARDAEWLYDHFVDHAVYAMERSDYFTSDTTRKRIE